MTKETKGNALKLQGAVSLAPASNSPYTTLFFIPIATASVRLERMYAIPCCRCGAPLAYPYRYCSQCGATQPITTPVSQAYLPPAYYPPAPGGTSDKLAVIVVLVIALIGLGTGALVYLILQGSIEVPPRPTVTFGLPTFVGSAVQVPVASVNVVAGPSNYRVNLGIGGVFGSSVPMPTSAEAFAYVAIGGTTYAVTWVDANGYVDAGDSFVLQVSLGFLSCPSAIAASFLLWQDASSLASISFDWPCESPPIVTFATPSPVAGTEIITVASASSASAPSNYYVSLEVNVTAGVTLAMPTSSGNPVALAIYGYPFVFTVTWTDIGGEGTLNGGDSFIVGYSGGALPGNTSYTFSLLWQKVNLVANTTWFTN